MADQFTLHVFPAQRGDALLIEYGPEEAPHRILIDGGIGKTGREHLLEYFAQLEAGTHIELLVVTHIDQDHIAGVVSLLEALPEHIAIDRVWFNARKHLPLEPQGVADAIALTGLLDRQHAAAWQLGHDGEAIAIAADGGLPVRLLPGGMKVTVLSPDQPKLEALALDWDKTLEEFGASEETLAQVLAPDADEFPELEAMGAEDIDVVLLAESPFKEDNTAPNGSSIAVLLEFAGRSALLLADAHPGRVLNSIRKLAVDARLAVDCVKLSHHGSRKNTSKALVQHLDAPRWILSSNGAQTRHPNLESVARVLHFCPGHKSLIFNYRTEYNEAWDDAGLMQAHDYDVTYGDGATPVTVRLLD